MYSARNVLLGITVVLALACSDAGPTFPSGESPSFHLSTTERARHEQLKELLAVQKERIKREKELRKSEFERARAEWKLFRQDLKRARKLQSKLVDLLRCEPRPYEGDAAIIGPQGGTLQVGDHELVIPRGALNQEQVIVAEAPTSSLVQVEFSPEGLTFASPARLTLSYKRCQVPADSDLLLAYLGHGNRILELPPAQDFREGSEVIGQIDHFSRYAVAY
jgi:hypothetical protein